MQLSKYCDIKLHIGISLVKMLHYLLDDVNVRGLED